MFTSHTPTGDSRSASFLTRVLLTCVLLTFSHGVIAGRAVAEDAPPPPKVISLVIDYGDGAQMRFPAVPWKAEMTIGDAMKFASQHRRGITYKSRGSGATELLHRIDDLENEGGSGMNWIFRVNGKLGDRSFAVTPLEPNDRILWKFDQYR